MKAFKWYLIILLLSTLIPMKLFSQDDLLAYVPGSICRNYINIIGNTNLNRFEFRMDFPLHQIFSVENSGLNTNQNTGLYEIPLPIKSFEAILILIIFIYQLVPDNNIFDLYLMKVPFIQYLRKS